MTKSEVSGSMWLYGADATDFNVPLEVQQLFLTERERRVEDVIRQLQSKPYTEVTEDEQQRMRDCISTRSWIEKMWKELGGRPNDET